MNPIHGAPARPAVGHTEWLSSMDLNRLVAFDALAQTRSVTGAAHRLGVSQSAMSHTLRRLREQFADPLLVRGHAGMVLTPRAESLAVPIRAALVSLQRAVSQPDGFAPHTANRVFSLVTPDLFDALLLPHLLGLMGETAPHVGLSVLPNRGVARDVALETGELDVALVPVAEGHSLDASNELRVVTLFRDTFCCFVRRGHPALRDGGLTMDAFVGGKHLLVTADGRGPGLVDAVLAERGLQRQVIVRVPSFLATPALVAASDMILTAPASLVHLIHGPGVVMVDPPLPLPGHSMTMMWHARQDADAGHRWFRAQLVRTSARLRG